MKIKAPEGYWVMFTGDHDNDYEDTLCLEVDSIDEARQKVMLFWATHNGYDPEEETLDEWQEDMDKPDTFSRLYLMSFIEDFTAQQKEWTKEIQSRSQAKARKKKTAKEKELYKELKKKYG